MPSGSQGIWGKLSDIWYVLAAVAVAGVTAGSLMADLWAAPQKADRALTTAEENALAIERLHRTVRVYLCSREELEQQVRYRLNCAEFETRPRSGER